LDGGVGLWVLPSYLNHTCVDCNCTWSVHSGDWMFVRAMKPVAEGEELTISYLAPMLPYRKRKPMFDGHDFECLCRMCVVEKGFTVAIHCEREKLLKFSKDSTDDPELASMVGPAESASDNDQEPASMDEMERAIEKLEKISGVHGVLSIQYIAAAHELCQMYSKIKLYNEAASMLKRFYGQVKNSRMDVLVPSATSIVEYHVTFGPIDDNTQYWVQELRRALICTYGTTKVMEYLNDEVLNCIKLAGIDL